jgi:molecular chaperone Hsp33
MKETNETNRPKDRLLQCVAAGGMLRVMMTDGTQLTREAQRLHDLSRVATAALGRQLMMTAMMAADLKGEADEISTIIKGNGPAGSMICTGNASLSVKGSVTNGQTELPPTPQGKLDVGGFVGSGGKLSVITDLGLKEPYIGVSNLVSGEIAVDFAQYYAASLQRPALVYLGVRMDGADKRVRSAAGVFAEPLPGCPEDVIDSLQAKATEIAKLSARIDDGETLESFLADVFGAFDAQIVSEREPQYRCDCSKQRVERALIATGARELRAMIDEDHGAEVSCRFCDKTYHFKEEELEKLLQTASMKQDEDKH